MSAPILCRQKGKPDDCNSKGLMLKLHIPVGRLFIFSYVFVGFAVAIIFEALLKLPTSLDCQY
jgi:hypothetical protein